MVPTATVDAGTEPAPTLCQAEKWVYTRPSLTLAGHDLERVGGTLGPGKGFAKGREGAVQLTTPEALILQSFRPDLPLVGSRSSQFLQIGNAVPPVMAAAIVGQLADLERLVAA